MLPTIPLAASALVDIYCTNGDVFVLAFQYRVVGSLES